MNRLPLLAVLAFALGCSAPVVSAPVQPTPAVTLVDAIFAGDLPAAEKLVESGANLEERGLGGYTPLLVACNLPGRYAFVRLLVYAGADINAVEENGWNALFMASHREELDSTVFLLKHKARIDAVDKRGDTAVGVAAARGQPESVKILVAAGASLSIRNKLGHTPIEHAKAELLKYREHPDLTSERIAQSIAVMERTRS